MDASLSRLRSRFAPRVSSGSAAEEPPLRRQLLSLDLLKLHARAVAQRQTIGARKGPNLLLPRLAANERILREYNEQTLLAEKSRRITPAAEWLLDNFHLIEEQIRTARRHLPRGFSRQLPHLKEGPLSGAPRVYELALELISHIDGRVDGLHLSSFVAAFQEVTRLKLGELWAVPIMLRLALIENLRRVAVELGAARKDRDLADQWADRALEAAESKPASLVVVLGEMSRAHPVLSQAFVAEFWRRTQERLPPVNLAVSWIEEHLAERGLSLEQMVQSESQQQAATQVSVGNCIGSLRFLDAMDWREFVQSQSVVELALRTDPANMYARMDFATRDHYRHMVERLARLSDRSELEVAEAAIRLALEQKRDSTDERRAHVGYYLVGKGAETLERVVGMRTPLTAVLPRVARHHPLAFYLIGILGLTIAGALLLMSWAATVAPVWTLALMVPFALLCMSQLGVSLVNWFATVFVEPSPLPRLDFSRGIPATHATLVAVPTLLSNLQGIDHLLESLEVHYLANRDDNVYFALLTDFRDALEEREPGDDELARHAVEGVEALNEKYQSDRPSIFFFFHRPRRWNECEGVWMGYERKRGKLSDLNSCLRGGSPEAFSHIVGDLSLLPHIKYVLTLDTDTQLPRDAARQLAATMAHPLNCPVYDLDRGLIVDGYSILQPRVAVSLPSAGRSHFVKLFAGEQGVDPYTRAVSDVYQDVFHEGSFIGKGIYDVDAFQLAVGGKFPENRILSHDLLEGSYARSALVSDVQLFEDSPARYSTDTQRRHRWMRGDWQIATWLLPRLPGPDVRRVNNPLTGLSRWKIFDNLRRSLVPPALVVLLVLGWCWLPQHAVGWSALILVTIGLPSVLGTLMEGLRWSKELPLTIHLRTVGRFAARQAGQVLLTIAFLPHDACLSLDAIARTLGRLLFTRRKLLEWQSARDAEEKDTGSLTRFLATMWSAPALALAIGLLLTSTSKATWPVVLPFLVLWAASPAVAWWISLPLKERRVMVPPGQVRELRKLARKTWSYFEEFVRREDHWLPPDNYQELPRAALATRSSPTNMGMALLSTLAAHDFGYLTLRKLMDRLAATLATMEKLERYGGHFYNWYDTRTLKPMAPVYVSTVDNGNLAALLFTLHSGLLELAEQEWRVTRGLDGLRDTLGLLHEQAHGPALAAELHAIEQELNSVGESPAEALAMLERVSNRVARLGATQPGGASHEVETALHAFAEDCREQRDELETCCPWLLLIERMQPHLAADASGKLRGLWSHLNAPHTLRGFAKEYEVYLAELDEYLASTLHSADRTNMLSDLRRLLGEAGRQAQLHVRELEKLAQQCDALARMDFSLLYDPSRELFSIGYNVSQHRLEPNCYDLLASEARLASFVAIALGQVPQRHWFLLGRLLTTAHGFPTLISWSGSMFEYLMPMLVMPTYENTLLDISCRSAVARQMEYGRQMGVPWGISESGYNLRDTDANYQYRAFGVPGLGFKRGLAADLVIAPYATVMALMVAPQESCRNLEALRLAGGEGRFGLFEAIDYTLARVPRGKPHAVVQSFMAHHQGMCLLSLAHVLLDQPMQRRFCSNPLFKSAELLLHERVPRAISVLYPHEFEAGTSRGSAAAGPILRVFTNPNVGPPEVHLLSNGRYHVMVTNAGGGFSRWNDVALTRWREDPTRDCWGTFLYLRDRQSGQFWSTAYQPTLLNARSYEAIFSQGRAEFRVRQNGIDAHTEISVSPEDDVEVRRVMLTNHSNSTRTLEVTSYAEVVLNAAAADLAHPAFSNLFIQTEILTHKHAVLCSRRPRAPGETHPWFGHLLLVRGPEVGTPSFETDRARFIGRGRSVQSPAAMSGPSRLSGSEGSPLDPIVALRRTIQLTPRGSARVTLVAGVAPTRDGILGLVEKYQDPTIADRSFELAWTHGLIMLRHLNATEPDAQLYGRLASALLYSQSARRANAGVLARNRRGQRSLWSVGLSGDLPILLVHCTRCDRIELVRQLVQAHAYWRLKGLLVDLVILSEEDSVYRQALHDQVLNLIASSNAAHLIDKPGGIFARQAAHLSPEDVILLKTAARVVLSDEHGSLAEQIKRRARSESSATPSPKGASFGGRMPSVAGNRKAKPDPSATELPKRDLIFFNGLGGFTRDGREYVITLRPGETTPAPWVNVIGNPGFGTLVSESGGAYTWSENCHEFRLTPWYNDAVTDLSGEAFYLRDEQSGQVWSPTPLPSPGHTPYVSRHGFGYSVFEHTEDGIASELWIYVSVTEPVKFALLKLRNHSRRTRRLSVTGYWEWVLGEMRHKNAPHVMTELDSSSGAILAQNHYNSDFDGRVAFVTSTVNAVSFTGSRTEFLGRNGTFAQPAALGPARLSGELGIGLDPCTALQVAIELAPAEERELAFVFGCGRDLAKSRDLVERFRNPDACREALQGVWGFWNHTLGAVYVETPEPALNVLANGWLLYQTLSCRLWARTGFYQSSGAFGFRDQLQDSLALVHSRPDLLREQLLRAAAHQFFQGDVLHWWHPPLERGVRTHFSDDYLWLPYAACHYVETIGDTGVLDEPVPLLEGREVRPEEEAYYDAFQPLPKAATLYEHCVLAIRHGLRFGGHGLPLIGGGDWNDGMNLIGHQGKGESVWLAFFLFDVLRRFARLAQQRGDHAFASECQQHAESLRANIEQHGWDGHWYRRAYFDHGEPLGSALNPECQIDALPQCWSVLSGAGDLLRSRRALDAVAQRLVRREARLIQLFDPPFDRSPLEPGYIKGYVPGVRENGGQYTHVAIWTVMAFALAGDTARAWELFTLINPVLRSQTAADVARYRVEPYVVAADIYSVPPHAGRGGWSWYTGSAGWMQRLMVETLLGVTLQVDRLRFTPRIPPAWQSFKIHYRYRETVYHVTLINEAGDWRGPQQITVDGQPQPEAAIPLTDDRREHQVEVIVSDLPPSR